MTKTPEPTQPKEHQHGLVYRLRNYFLTGLIVAGPVAITAALIWWFINTVDGWVKPFLPAAVLPYIELPYNIPGIGVLVAIFSLTVLGFLTANYLGRSLIDYGQSILERTPLVRGVYKAFKQVFEMVFSTTSTSFKRAGLIEYPYPGLWSVVLISSPAVGEISQKVGDEEHIGVFLPCAPNPTTGFFFYVPKSKIKELDISVDEAFKLIVSAGLIRPGEQITS